MTPVPKMKLWRAEELEAAVKAGAVFRAKNLDGNEIRFNVINCDSAREIATVSVIGSRAAANSGEPYRDEVSYDAILFSDVGWPKFIQIWRRPNSQAS